MSLPSCIAKGAQIVVAFSLSTTTFAQVECDVRDAGSQIAICAELAKKEADIKLNDSYKALIDRAAARYIYQHQSQPEEEKVFLVKLRESQRVWIKLRDANCALEGIEGEWDKPTYKADLSKCVARMSLERATYLDRVIPAR